MMLSCTLIYNCSDAFLPYVIFSIYQILIFKNLGRFSFVWDFGFWGVLLLFCFRYYSKQYGSKGTLSSETAWYWTIATLLIFIDPLSSVTLCCWFERGAPCFLWSLQMGLLPDRRAWEHACVNVQPAVRSLGLVPTNWESHGVFGLELRFETTRVEAGLKALCDALTTSSPPLLVLCPDDALLSLPSLGYPPSPHRVSAHTWPFAHPSSVQLPTNLPRAAFPRLSRVPLLHCS